MKKLALAVTLLLTASTSHATMSWNFTNPGAGGAFQSVDIKGSGGEAGTILIGSDVSGVYRKTSSGTTWTPVGILDGLVATDVMCVKWTHGNGKFALAGTHNGIFRSTDGGLTWGTQNFAGATISAIGWGYGTDTNTVYCAGRQDNTETYDFYKSTDGGATWGTVHSWDPAATDTAGAVIKLLVDPSNSARLLALFGLNSDAEDNTTNQCSPSYVRREIVLWDGSAFTPVFYSDGSGRQPVDMAFRSDGMLFVSAASKSQRSCNGVGQLVWIPSDDDTGLVWCGINKNASPAATYDWTSTTVTNRNGIGAVWFDGAYKYVQMIGQDACGENTYNGRWRSDSTKAASFSQVDDGVGTLSGTATWEAGYLICVNARGRGAGGGIANCLSAKGEYWVTKSGFAWYYDTSGDDKYTNVFTSSSSPWNTKQLENVNTTALALSGTTLWAGYYDIGLWKSTAGSGWSDMNMTTDTDWCGSDQFGGNVNAIAFSGNNMFVIASPSSKTYNYRLWRSTDGGATWNKYGSGGSVDMTAGGYYMRSLTVDPNSGDMYLCRGTGAAGPSGCGIAYRSTDGGNSWSSWIDKSSDTLSFWTVSAVGGTVLAGSGATYRQVIYRKVGSGTPSLVLGGTGNTGSSCAGSNGVNTAPHREEWPGVHQIVYGPDGFWYATFFKGENCSASTQAADSIVRGVFWSEDDGQNWKHVAGTRDQVLRRGVLVDSCAARMWLTSSAGLSSGPNTDHGTTREDGVQVLRKGTSNWSLPITVSGGANYRNPTGTRMAKYDGVSPGNLYVATQGYGVVWTETNEPDECQTTRPGGGGMGARRPLEEQVATLPRTVFSLSEARELVRSGRLELYDVSGRRARSIRAGVFFQLERDKLGVVVARRTVMVTP